MIEIWEFTGKELDPIDDVRRRLENFYTENYFYPLNGDWISDDYWRIIDLTTQPGALNVDETGKLNRSILRLSQKFSHIQAMLGNSSLVDAYVDTVGQINAVNSADPNRRGIVKMTAV